MEDDFAVEGLGKTNCSECIKRMLMYILKIRLFRTFLMNEVNRESEKTFIRNNYAAKVSNIEKNNIKPKSSSRHVENARLFPLKLLILKNKRTG